MGGSKEESSETKDEKKMTSTSEGTTDTSSNVSELSGSPEFTVLSIEEAQRILDKQYENHYKVQEGLFRLARVLIALITVIVTLISILVSQSVRDFIPVSSFQDNIQSAISGISSTFTVRFTPELVFHLVIPEWFTFIVFVFSMMIFLLISASSALIGTILLSSLIHNLLNTFSAPVLKPVHDDSHIEHVSKLSDVKGEMAQSYKEWIKFNRHHVRRSNQALNVIYQRILHTLTIFAIAILYALITYFAAFREGLTITVALIFLVTTYHITSPKMDDLEVDVLSLLKVEEHENENLSLKERVFLTIVFLVCLLVLLFTVMV